MDKYRFQQIEYRMKDKPSWQIIGTNLDGKIITQEEYIYVERLRRKNKIVPEGKGK